jgi:hypothetical protein
MQTVRKKIIQTKNKRKIKYLRKTVNNRNHKNKSRDTKQRKKQSNYHIKRKLLGGENDECAICFEPLNDDIITTVCNHTFHKKCLIETCKSVWNISKNNCKCPLCRKPIDDQIKPLIPKNSDIDSLNLLNLSYDDFVLFANHYLDRPSMNPDEILFQFLDAYEYSFDYRIPDIITYMDEPILVFEKKFVRMDNYQHALYKYIFSGVITRLPFYMFRGNKKYFQLVIIDEEFHFEEV